MTVALEENANDQSSFPIEFELRDGLGLMVFPNSITWKLTDNDGVVINSRSAETVTPAPDFTILLYGDDLKASDGTGRKLLIQAPCDSSYMDDMPNNEEFSFSINDFITVS